MKKEAYLWSETDEGRVLCLTCQRRCVMPEGRKGYCHTKINKDGRLFSMIYGHSMSLRCGLNIH